MRTWLATLLFLMIAAEAKALGLLKREPREMSPGTTVYVDNGRCSPGKVLKVTAAFKGTARKKTCVTVDPRDDG